MHTFPRFVFSLALLSGLVVKQGDVAFAHKRVTSSGAKNPDTYFVSCDDEHKANRVTGQVSVYAKWRAYAEVSVQQGCLYTSRLWVARQGGAYRLVYLMPPQRESSANGIKILGWAPGSRIILMQTERWTIGSDAGPTEAVVAIDAKTGEVYEPDLSVVLQDRKPRCAFRVTGGGFASEPNVVLLVRVELFSSYEGDETEADVPPKERCTAGEETWRFDYATGEVKRVDNSTLLRIAAAQRVQP